MLKSSSGVETDEELDQEYKKAKDILEQKLGKEHMKVAQVLYDLAKHYESHGNITDADSIHHTCLSIRKKALGDTHPGFSFFSFAFVYLCFSDVGESLHSIAKIYAKQRKVAEAAQFFEECLKIYKSRLGASHHKVAQVTEDLEFFQKHQSNPDQNNFAVINTESEASSAATKSGWALLGIGVITTAAYYFLKK